MNTDTNTSPSLRANITDHELVRISEGKLIYPIETAPGYGEVVELRDGILWTRMPLPFSLDHINLYLIPDGDGYAIVDAGLNTSMVRDLWTGLLEGLGSPPINHLIVTHYHPDHIGLAGWLGRETGALLHMSHGEYHLARSLYLDSRETTPDEVVDFYARVGFGEQALEVMRQRGFGMYRKGLSELPLNFSRLKNGGTITIGDHDWRVVVGRGHSPEHACLYDPARHILCAGDQILPRITSNVSVYPNEPHGDPLDDWLQSLSKLEQLAEDTLILPAHGKPFLGLHKRTHEIRESHLRRLKTVSDLLDVPKTAIEALPVLFKRKLTDFDFILATGECLAHLHYLERRGFITRGEKDGLHTFVASRPLDLDELELGASDGWP